MNLEKYVALPMAALSACVVSISAQVITVGSYDLHNHPGGSENPPEYGLRLDGLLGDNSAEYTFDFNHASSDMNLTFDGSKIVISGSAYGGEDIGSSYDPATTAVWDIHFEYLVGVSQPGDGGLDDLIVTATGANFGSISSNQGSFELSDKAASNGISFHFGDSNGNGHRGADGISGWGWLMHGADCTTGTDCQNVQYSDWLFTATPTAVPVPAAAWLFSTAIIGLFAAKRRR